MKQQLLVTMFLGGIFLSTVSYGDDYTLLSDIRQNDIASIHLDNLLTHGSKAEVARLTLCHHDFLIHIRAGKSLYDAPKTHRLIINFVALDDTNLGEITINPSSALVKLGYILKPQIADEALTEIIDIILAQYAQPMKKRPSNTSTNDSFFSRIY